jgi:hypothetical protein
MYMVGALCAMAWLKGEVSCAGGPNRLTGPLST